MVRASDEYGVFTPAGRVRLVFAHEILTRILFDSDAPHALPPSPFKEWFEAYMDHVFLPVPENIVPPRTNPEALMRESLQRVPPGTMVTYGELAVMMGSSPRGAASVLRANPLPVLVPCHRVVAAGGPGGYSQGLHRKLALLAWEGVDVDAIWPGQDRSA